MKTVFAVLTVMVAFTVAQADIPGFGNRHRRPPTQEQELKVTHFSGEKAEKKWDSIKSAVLGTNTSGWNGMSQSYKAERNKNGTVQTVCVKTESWRDRTLEPTYSCKKEESLDGSAVPRFVFKRRLG